MNQIIKKNTNVQDFQMIVLTEDEIDKINGGFAPLVAAAAVTTCFAALSAAESFGEKLGKALYYATH